MSYDLRIHVKAEGCDAYPVIATPEHDSPTYNLSKMFRECMNWNYSQSEQDENGKWNTVYYRCSDVIQNIENGIRELHTNRNKYIKLEPENHWGSVGSAITALESLRDCIYEQAEEIPMDCLYMSW